MGKHAAPDGTSAHPIVAAALASRPTDAPVAHRDEPDERSDGVGWPAPPEPDGSGLGWPGKNSTASAVDESRPAAPRPATPRRGWRRFFRLSSAA